MEIKTKQIITHHLKQNYFNILVFSLDTVISSYLFFFINELNSIAVEALLACSSAYREGNLTFL